MHSNVLATLALGAVMFIACNEAPKPAESDQDTTAAAKDTVKKETVCSPFLDKKSFQSTVDGKSTDVVVGFNDLKQYQGPGDAYFGALVGRVGNRIAKGKFLLDGKAYTLAVN